MRYNQANEDYLEAILLLSKQLEDVHQIEIARRMQVSQPAVKKALKNLMASGYIQMDGLHVNLTAKGKEYANGVYARHCAIKTFLVMHGVSEESAEEDACRMEHVISAETLQMMQKFVEEN